MRSTREGFAFNKGFYSMKPVYILGIALVATGVAARAQYESDLKGLEIRKPEDKVDFPTVPAPAGAIVLFDGKNLDQWAQTDGKSKPNWRLTPPNAVQVHGGNMITRQKFDGRFKLHVEFRVPYMPKAKGQGRGNSGIYLQGRYEVQVLDSYGLESQTDDCGGIYKVAVPKVNACKAPTVWQAYDIDFKAPVYRDGKKIEPPKITVTHNGQLIHENVSITVDNTVAGLGGDPSKPGPIMLQDHGNPVQYRNIWLVPVKE